MRNSALLIILYLLFINCGSVPDIHYYTIDYDIAEPANLSAKYHYTLGVETFSADPLYEEDRIVYRESPYEVKFYNYHQWIVPPKQMTTEKALAQLSASGIFSRVTPFPQYNHVDFWLRGTIKKFEEWDEDGKWFTNVKIHLELLDRDSNTLIWQHDYFDSQPVSDKQPVALVQALGESVETCLNQAITDLDQFFGSYGKK
ncbi:membrane integrity-associated transporter subunit PqiC [candidate division KSB1 bacterium]|nr:membrane integrity-associated transporter subunit PqiC [candidate division KSB1 bacterium]